MEAITAEADLALAGAGGCVGIRDARIALFILVAIAISATHSRVAVGTALVAILGVPVITYLVDSGIHRPIAARLVRSAVRATPVPVTVVAVITYLARRVLYEAVPTTLFGLAIRATAVAGDRVPIIADLAEIDLPVAAYLVGPAVLAAAIPILVVAIITDLFGLNDPVATRCPDAVHAIAGALRVLWTDQPGGAHHARGLEAGRERQGQHQQQPGR